MEQNQFNRLQMVQFECPRVINSGVSFTFEEFPFPIFSALGPSPFQTAVRGANRRYGTLCGNKNWFIMGGWVKSKKKVEHFWSKISLTSYKRSSLNAPGSQTPVSHSHLVSSLFPFSSPALPSFLSVQYTELDYYGRLGKNVKNVCNKFSLTSCK